MVHKVRVISVVYLPIRFPLDATVLVTPFSFHPSFLRILIAINVRTYDGSCNQGSI